MLDGIGRIKKPGKLLKQYFFTFVQLLWPIECKYLEYDSHETAYGPKSIVYFSCSRQLQHTLKNSKSGLVSDYRIYHDHQAYSRHSGRQHRRGVLTEVCRARFA